MAPLTSYELRDNPTPLTFRVCFTYEGNYPLVKGGVDA
jgi:hypothetical protein